MLWGITPVLNFLEELKTNSSELPDSLNILLVGGADVRHVLKTLAQRYRFKTKVKLNFYLMEACAENIAKQILLLNIAMQPSSQLGLVQKTRYFMELYGNMLIRPSVAKYLNAMAQKLTDLITNDKQLQDVMPFLSLAIQYRERDYVENLYKFWTASDDFDICQAWDNRLRKTLGVRYDSRVNIFDWDLQMRYHNIGGHQIGAQEYKSFRLNGLAFTWLESEVSRTNRSMVTGIITNGTKFGHYGYLGDMVTGPFAAYGLDCEDQEFLKKTNNINAFRSTDVTERNLQQIFHEIEFQTEYKHLRTNNVTLGHIIATPVDTNVIEGGNCGDVRQIKTPKCFPLEAVKIKFLSFKMLPLMQHKEEFNSFFDLMYFGNSYIKFLEVDLLKTIAKDNSKLIIENQLFILAHRDKDLKEFGEQLDDKIKELKHPSYTFDVLKDMYARIIVRK